VEFRQLIEDRESRIRKFKSYLLVGYFVESQASRRPAVDQGSSILDPRFFNVSIRTIRGKRYTFVSGMKKALVIALASMYLLVSSGVVVNMHYCMGKLASLGIGHHDSKSCSTCGMDNNGCCKDEVKVVKIQDNQEAAAGFTAIPKMVAEPIDWTSLVSMARLAETAPAHHFAHAPPEGDGRSAQSLLCVFRI
jgi:hypothetical protein